MPRIARKKTDYISRINVLGIMLRHFFHLSNSANFNSKAVAGAQRLVRFSHIVVFIARQHGAH